MKAVRPSKCARSKYVSLHDPLTDTRAFKADLIAFLSLKLGGVAEPGTDQPRLHAYLGTITFCFVVPSFRNVNLREQGSSLIGCVLGAKGLPSDDVASEDSNELSLHARP